METQSSFAALSKDLAAAVEASGKSVVAVHARPRTPSSGVLWRPGVIVTADHVVRQEEDIQVRIGAGQALPATIAGRDPGTDLAVLRVESGDAPPVTLADPASLRIGSLVLSVGRGPTAALGLISGLDGPGRTWKGGQLEQLVRLDTAILLGFSGGALVGPDGSVLGITTSGLLRGAGAALTSATVDRVVDRLLTKGDMPRGYLGVGMQPVRLPESLGAKLQPPATAGIILLMVEPGSPAEKAGLMIGDVLVSVDGNALSETDDLQPFLDPDSVGKSFTLKILRGGAPIDASITVGARPRRGA